MKYFKTRFSISGKWHIIVLKDQNIGFGSNHHSIQVASVSISKVYWVNIKATLKASVGKKHVKNGQP